MGVFASKWCRPLAEALGKLGSRRALVVHGEGSVDEIAVRGETQIAEWDEQKKAVREYTLSPSDFGLDPANPRDLVGGDASHNAKVARAVLSGEHGAPRTAVLMAAAAAQQVAGAVSDLKEGSQRAAEAIDSGQAKTHSDKVGRTLAPMSILEKILATKKEEVQAAKKARPLSDLEMEAKSREPTRGFRSALRRDPGTAIRAIAEIKRASPSAGPIRPDATPSKIAQLYENAGASCISVLTDTAYFDGHLSFLQEARNATKLPLLRKDFIVDPYQIVEARAAGADAVLLIVAALEPRQLADLRDAASAHQLDALIEIHNEAEADTALKMGANLIGVNHRDLTTFTIDMSLTARLFPHVTPGTVLVGESGIKTFADVQMLAESGADAILVGERLMRAENPGAALTELLRGKS